MKKYFRKDKSSDEGLPEVAQENQQKNPIFLAILGIILVLMGIIYFYTSPKDKNEKNVEETYTLATDPSLQRKDQSAQLTDSQSKQTGKTQTEIDQAKVVLLLEKQKQLQQRLLAPLMLVNNNQQNKSTENVTQSEFKSKDPNTQFMNQVSAQNLEASIATSIGSLKYIVGQGNYIHAILEPAVNSDLPGSVRAIVSEPIYSEDGSQILVPIGSRLIGQYKSGMLQGQSRIFIVWTRLLTPEGLAINLGSLGVDSLGVVGIGADEVDRHFWERFGMASLLSVIGAGTANLGVSGSDQDNPASIYRAAIANSFAQSANESYQSDGQIPPTLREYQGKPIMIFIARDLNFQNAMREIKPKINIF